LINDYDNIIIQPKLNKCGGMVIFIKQDIKFTIRNDLYINDTTVDNVWIEINYNKINYICAFMYRHPKLNSSVLTAFKNNLKASLDKVDNVTERNLIIMGDININLKDRENQIVNDYITFLYINKLFNAATNNDITRDNIKPNNTSKGTIIDHIYFKHNMFNRNTEKTLITSGMKIYISYQKN
jgi:hypothetical protein